LPGLIDARHRLIGSLPIQIYASAPQSVRIKFLDWKGSFPFRVTFHVIDPTEGAPGSPSCPPPLKWQPDEQKYVEAPGDFYGKCTATQ